MSAVLILGATSGIAKPLARRLGRSGRPLILAGRDPVELERLAADLRVRGDGAITVEPFDALDFDGHPAFWRRVYQGTQARLAGVVLAYGILGDQQEAQASFAEARRLLEVNLLSPISILGLVAQDFERRGSGFICALGSVAGDRGRQSNYLYGTSKAGLSTFLEGLRHRLHPRGVQVLEVRPGFVDTKMTAGLLDPRSPLVATPEAVAAAIEAALEARRDLIYAPWYWRPIMAGIRGLPGVVFHRLKL